MKRFAIIMMIAILTVVALPLPAAAATNGARGQRVIRTALSYLGRPYVFGTAGPRAFDCSGFTRFVLRKAVGISLPHSAAAQSRFGTRIAAAQRQPGDLIFFKNTYKAGVSHVGFWMGNNRMVHAWPRGGVRVDNLNTSYFRAKYHSSRTVLR
jgi:peptidoglycan endopeptidase LytE